MGEGEELKKVHIIVIDDCKHGTVIGAAYADRDKAEVEVERLRNCNDFNTVYYLTRWL